MTATSLPEQICLPGQTHVANGPHDQTGMYRMHHAFRRDLTRFEAAVRATPIGAVETWAAIGARWDRFGEILHHHHGVEDTEFWPVLIRHAQERADDDAVEMLHEMQAEHELIDPALAAVTAGFRAMVEHPCADHRNALDVLVTSVRAALLDHLQHEETEALPFLQAVVTESEYATIDKAAARAYPPTLLPFLLPWVAEGVPQSVLDRVVSEAGAAYGVLLRLSRGRYTRRERRPFAYA